MKPIRTLNELTQALNSNPKSTYPSLLKYVQLDANAMSKWSMWREGDYTRNCLARNSNFEIILLCWDKDAKTPIHDHGGEDCWVYQVDGEVEEIRYSNQQDSLEEDQRIVLHPGKLTFMNDHMGYHLIQNVSKKRAMTLHIYAAPIDRCQIYDDSTKRFKMKDMQYCSIAECISEN